MTRRVGPPYPTTARSSAWNVHPSSSPLKMRYHAPASLDDDTDARANMPGDTSDAGTDRPPPSARWLRPNDGDVRGT